MSNDFINSLGNLDVTKTGGAKVSKIDPASIPGFAGIPKSAVWDPSKYRVRYLRVNLSDADSLSQAEDVETRAIRDEGVYILNRERFVFMDQILLLLNYIERIDD